MGEALLRCDPHEAVLRRGPHQAVRRTETSVCRQLMCVYKVVQDDEALLRCEPSAPSSAAYRHRDQRVPQDIS